jgi:hypothetical protein
MTIQGTQLAPWLERAWLERYLERELEPSEVEWFEAYALERPGLVAQIEIDNDLRDGLEMSETARDVRIVTSSKRRIRLNVGVASWAAALLIGFSLGHYAFVQKSDQSFVANPVHILVDTRRGTTESIDDRTFADATHFVVDIALPDDVKTAQARLKNGRVVPLSVSNDGFAAIFVEKRGLGELSDAILTFTTRGNERNVPINLTNVAKGSVHE